MADEEWGQAVAALVVLDAAVDIEALKRHCAEHLPAFKVPKRIDVVDALPRTASGKLRRSELAPPQANS
jgi:fatty-acyl-CoA synthase/long-chain acyl-CoA synthetase